MSWDQGPYLLNTPSSLSSAWRALIHALDEKEDAASPKMREGDY